MLCGVVLCYVIFHFIVSCNVMLREEKPRVEERKKDEKEEKKERKKEKKMYETVKSDFTTNLASQRCNGFC